MTVEAINAYFTPLDYFFYLMTLLVIMVVYYQWKWSKVCKNNVLILVQRSDGHGDYELAPQDGGSVTIGKDDKARTWPINELATIDVPYPGVGFIPRFMQKQIRMVVVAETDWEPITNRSPDREMIASPAFLANLIHEKITAAVITINKEMWDSLTTLTQKLNKILSPTVFYIGIGLTLAAIGFLAYQIIPAMTVISEMGAKLDAISRALGVIS